MGSIINGGSQRRRCEECKEFFSILYRFKAFSIDICLGCLENALDETRKEEG